MIAVPGSSYPSNVKEHERERMKEEPPKTLTDRQAAEIKALADLPEEQIDTSDIPEIPDWSDARRGLLDQPPATRA